METQSTEKKKNTFWKFVFAHKLITFLLLIIVGVFLWSIIKISIMSRHFETEKQNLVAAYDSLAVYQMENTAKVFSWAIRSEMTRDNLDQVNQFFLGFVKEPNVKKILLVETPSGKILVSSNKKDEGQTFSDGEVLKIENIVHQTNDSTVKIISPVMGLNSKMAVLVVEMHRLSKPLMGKD